MHVGFIAATVLVLLLSACGGGSATSAPPSTPGGSPGGASAAPIATGSSATAAIDLSGLDACMLLDEQALEGLTGESGFITDQFDSGHCFWGVPRAGVPQYVEINVFARPGGLSGYTFNPGEGCTSSPVAGVGTEARGGTCSDPQDKVYLLAWDRGVAVRLLVNEPKGPLEPEDLAATVRTVLEGLEGT